LAFFIIFIAFIHAFFAILQSVLSPGKIYGIYEREYAEPYGVFVSRNNYAAWMILALGIPFGLLFSGAVKKDKLLLIGAIVVTGGTSILLSRSRGGLIALVFEILLILLFAIRGETKLKRNLKLASAAALIILVLIGTVFVGTESTITRLAEDSKEIQFEISRQNIWSNSLQIIKDSFPLGVGLGAFGVAYTRYDHSSGIARVEQAHNDYLQIATDAGLIGILLAALFGYLLYKEILPTLKQKDAELRGISIGATGCVIGLLVHSLFDFALHTLSIAIFFLFLIAMIYRINTISITDGRS
ncbi:MAG TPA: O-antigen ligase family protein, partial [Pyrinomonadaceae bacterium]|nr:O-antigen ligase family protein [Pyrinomonadaceae bacterium]